MFYFNYQTDEKVDEEEWTEAKQRSGSVKEFGENVVRGTASLVQGRKPRA